MRPGHQRDIKAGLADTGDCGHLAPHPRNILGARKIPRDANFSIRAQAVADRAAAMRSGCRRELVLDLIEARRAERGRDRSSATAAAATSRTTMTALVAGNSQPGRPGFGRSDIAGRGTPAARASSAIPGKARAEAGRSCGLGSRSGAMTGRSGSGTADRSGAFCRAAMAAAGVAPISSVPPNPIAADARTKPRLYRSERESIWPPKRPSCSGEA